MNMSARLKLPLLAAGQAQKEMTVNETLSILDAVLAAAVEEPPRNSPPANPASGACYIVGAAPSGEWTGCPHHLAVFTAGGWRLIGPVEGMIALVKPSGLSACFINGAWQIGSVVGSKLMIGGKQVVGGRGAAVALPSGGTIVDVEARSTIAAIAARLKEHGLID